MARLRSCVLLIVVLVLGAAAPEHPEENKPELFYCHGSVPETETIERLRYPKGIVFKPWQEEQLETSRVQTVGGKLVARYWAHSLWLENKKIAGKDVEKIIQVYSEESGPPAIVVVYFYRGDTSNRCLNFRFCDDRIEYRIVDTGVSPPFISKTYLPIVIDTRPGGHTATGGPDDCKPYAKGMTIKKLDAHTYSFSGKSFEEKDASGEPINVTFIYDRKKKTIQEEK